MDVVVVGVLGVGVGLLIGTIYSVRIAISMLNKVQKELDKNKQLFHLMNRWVKIQQRGIHLYKCLERKGFKKIAIYGMGIVGERLLEELRQSEIEVSYGIDINAKNIYSTLKIVTPSEDFQEIDAIIVTSIGVFEEVEDMLIGKGVSCPILSFEDLLFDN